MVERQTNIMGTRTFLFVGHRSGDYVALSHRPEWTESDIDINYEEGLTSLCPVDMVSDKDRQRKLKIPAMINEETLIVEPYVEWEAASLTNAIKAYPYQELQNVEKDASFSSQLDPRFIAMLETTTVVKAPMKFIVPKRWCLVADEQHFIGLSDLMSLSHLSMPSLFHTLRSRYVSGEIYSGVGPRILLAVNPYIKIPALTTPAVTALYRTTLDIAELNALPPHPFALAQQAYMRLMHSRKSQSVIISGESGAGKTETAKLILKFLAHCDTAHRLSLSQAPLATTDVSSKLLTPRMESKEEKADSIETLLLQSNPVLESFGNAQTQRNDNSSRFGKFIRIFYSDSNLIESTAIDTFLLEKCRLTTLGDNESNYHVFYQFIRGLDCLAEDLRTSFQLEEFLSDDGTFACRLLPPFKTTSDSMNGVFMQHRDQFISLREALQALGIQNEGDVWSLLAACIHLGEIQFIENGPSTAIEPSTMKNLKAFESLIHPVSESHDTIEPLTPRLTSPHRQFPNESKMSPLRNRVEPQSTAGVHSKMSVNEQSQLATVLTWKGIVDPEKKCLLMTPRSIAEANAVRDSMIRKLYAILFHNIVQSVNRSLTRDRPLTSTSTGSNPSHLTIAGGMKPSIGLLDIYGFEVFGTDNSFEQLCINYANERLQRQFNHHVFEQEQVIYEQEMINWSQIVFNDNINILTALDHKTTGVWSLLDSECNRPSGSDQNYNLMMQRHKSKVVGRPSNPFIANSHFQVHHYAGAVDYDSCHFLMKNRDSLDDDVSNYLKICDLSLLKTELNEIDSLSDAHGNRPPSGSGTTRASGQRKLHQASVSKVFREQLDHLITLIDSTGPAYIRCIKPNQEKRAAYFQSEGVIRQLEAGGMLESIRIRRQGYSVRLTHQEACNLIRPIVNDTQPSSLLHAFQSFQDDMGWQIGATKIFLKDHLHARILREIDLARSAAATSIQSFHRGLNGRAIANRRRKAVISIQAASRRLLAIRLLQRHKRARQIQAAFRGHLARRRYQRLVLERKTAVATISDAWRALHIRRSAYRMTAWISNLRLMLPAFRRYQMQKTSLRNRRAIVLSALYLRYRLKQDLARITIARQLTLRWRLREQKMTAPRPATPINHSMHVLREASSVSSRPLSATSRMTATPELVTIETLPPMSDSEALIGGPYNLPSLKQTLDGLDDVRDSNHLHNGTSSAKSYFSNEETKARIEAEDNVNSSKLYRGRSHNSTPSLSRWAQIPSGIVNHSGLDQPSQAGIDIRDMWSDPNLDHYGPEHSRASDMPMRLHIGQLQSQMERLEYHLATISCHLATVVDVLASNTNSSPAISKLGDDQGPVEHANEISLRCPLNGLSDITHAKGASLDGNNNANIDSHRLPPTPRGTGYSEYRPRASRRCDTLSHRYGGRRGSVLAQLSDDNQDQETTSDILYHTNNGVNHNPGLGHLSENHNLGNGCKGNMEHQNQTLRTTASSAVVCEQDSANTKTRTAASSIKQGAKIVYDWLEGISLSEMLRRDASQECTWTDGLSQTSRGRYEACLKDDVQWAQTEGAPIVTMHRKASN